MAAEENARLPRAKPRRRDARGRKKKTPPERGLQVPRRGGLGLVGTALCARLLGRRTYRIVGTLYRRKDKPKTPN